MSFNIKRIVLGLLLIIPVLAAIILKHFLLETSLGLFILVLYLISTFTLGYFWWRCPNCKKHLGRYIDSSTHCKHCGKKLD